MQDNQQIKTFCIDTKQCSTPKIVEIPIIGNTIELDVLKGIFVNLMFLNKKTHTHTHSS